MKKLFSCLAFLFAFLTTGQVMAGGGGSGATKFYAKSTVAVAEESSGRGTVYFADGKSEETQDGNTLFGGDGQYVSFNVFVTPAEGYKFDKFTEDDGKDFTFNDGDPQNLTVYATSTDAANPNLFNFKAHFVEKGGPVESVSLTGAEGEELGYYVNVIVGETLQLKAVITPDNAENKNVTWEAIQDEEVISVDQNGLVTALATGQAAVVVTTEDGEKQAMVNVVVVNPADKTIADFLANGGTCLLTGVVSELNEDKDAFTLTDATGSVKVMTTRVGEDVEDGNEIVIKASYYDKTMKAVLGGTYIENHGVPAPPKVYTFEVQADEETFTVTPSDEEVKYYIEIVDAAYSDDAIEAYFDQIFDEMGSGLEYFTGTQTQSYADDWYIDEPGEYKIAVCAVSADYKRASDLKVVTFTIEAPAEPALADGDYLIMNVSGGYLGGGNDWGTHASLLGKPQWFTVAMTDGKYT
ncbi:MAG: Ig-like domain-containing protein, partial [Bacteroidales bacterium]|nr:Ig-like domain-containing protein [Bacteroidales bacterium]